MPANLTTKLGQLVDVLTPDTTNTRIGVANASPTRTLDVTGTGGFSGNLNVGGTSNVATGTIGIGVANNAAVLVDGRLDANGNTYGYRFVNGSAGTGATTLAVLTNGTHALQQTMFGTAWTTSGINRQGGGMILCDGPGGLTLNTQASQPIYFGINSTEAARFDTSGNLLVGTASSSDRLVVNGNNGIRVSGISTGNRALYIPSGDILFDNPSARSEVRNDGNSASELRLSGRGFVTVYTGGSGLGTGTEAARIDSSGNLLVGTTSNATTSRAVFRNTQNVLALDNSGGQYTTMTFCNNNTATAYVYYDNTNSRLYVQTGGSGGVYLAATGTSWTAVSDERVKDIIEPIENATDKLAGWRTVIGKYKTDKDGVRRSFLIAQDILKTFPEAVDATKPDEYGVNYQDTIPVLVAAIQELTTRLAALENK
jgi:hypothetical protein